MIKDFSYWLEYEGASYGSGRSEKVWLQDPIDKRIGLFKFPKTEDTTEHISEVIASDIAKLINIDCMEVELGRYNLREGSISYLINKKEENLIEGVRLINENYPNYDINTLYDSEKGEYYSLDMILGSLQKYNFQMKILEMLIFDYLIGNTDRHHSNWAVLASNRDVKLCPLYDNGSSLCCYLLEKKLNSYLGNDKLRFRALVDTKSKSRIRIDKYSKKEPTHLDILIYLKENYYEYIIEIIESIIFNITQENIDVILERLKGILSNERKILIKKFLIEKVNIIKREFEFERGNKHV